MTEHFKESLNIGELGEGMTWQYLSNQPNIKQVIDVRNDKRYFQKEDVDFLIITNENDVYKVEVKSDSKICETNNIVYEISTSGNKGCFEKTTADVIYYYDVIQRILYQLDIKWLRRYINTNNFKLANMGDNAQGYLIPKDNLLSVGILKKVKQIKLGGI